MSKPIAIDINQILKLLPHRYPFLLVDRVLEIEPRQSITALKNVTMNEPFFQGHFPDFPVMPGVLIIEALAQTAALLTFSEVPPVEMVLIDRPGMPFLGAGEASQGPSGAALANAVFDATGVRFRRLPLTPYRVLQGLKKA